jgi:uncharacterized membrane protein
MGVVSSISGQFTSAAPAGNGQMIVLVGAGFVISFVVSILLKMGTTNVYLKAHENTSALLFEDLWAPKRIISFTLACLLVGVIIVVGIILLIVPGIIWALRYCFVPYLIMDKGLDVAASLKESARITYGHKWQLFWLAILMALVNILGFICLFVGLLVSIPVTALAFVHAYRTLSKTA